MKFDIFLSICQTEVDGYLPTEKVMFENFFDQVRLADELGYGTAWVAETHLSCEIQKHGAEPVIPHFVGEIGLNTDILQLAHVIFAQTRNINVGSAVRNIFCNGGPIAHAEAIRTFLTLHGQKPGEKRHLNIGFASGRFDFSNRPYGIKPRNTVEKAAWPIVKGKALLEATEIFLRLLKGEKISRADVTQHELTRADFRTEADWEKVKKVPSSFFAAQRGEDTIPLAPFWDFEKVGVIPFDAPLDLLKLTIGSHDEKAQRLANTILPVGVFNLSITPPAVIDATHARMAKQYHPAGGPWRRDLMPRTAMVFIEDTTAKAKAAAEKAWVTYWKAMEGTLDQKKVDQAVENTLAGSPDDLAAAINAKYHPEDRLMLWFDFNTHDNAAIKRSMSTFMKHVAPQLGK
jgi:alkanesulfonate monooxygenase SsuD/methylene tetrahydromethanopterin reductase-like flavin-dependent oxidoreductase (luciferase family)